VKLYGKIVSLIIVVAVGMGLSSSLFVSRIMQDILEKKLEGKAKVIVQVVAGYVVQDVINNEVAPTKELLKNIISNNIDVDYAYVIGFNDKIFAHSFEGNFPRDLMERDHETALSDKSYIVRYSTSEGPILDVGYPLIDGMSAHFHVGMNESQSLNQTIAIRNRILIISLYVTLFGILFGIFLSRRITSPIGQLVDSMRSFGKGKVKKEIIYSGGGPEVEGLTIASNRMISDCKQADKALRKSETLLKATQKLAKIGGWEWDVEKQIVRWTEEVYRIHGFDPAEATSSSAELIERSLECYDPEDRLVILNAFKKCIKDGTAYDFDFPFTSASGRQIWIRSVAEPILVSGRITKVIGNIMDISERKRAENELQESESKYRAMMDSMKDPVYICSPDYRVEYMNPAMIGRTGRDATGAHCFKAIHDLDEKCSWCRHYEAQQGKSFKSDIVSPKDNHSYYVTHSSIVHENGSISKMTILRDTTELKKMETQLQQAQKMESIGTLAGGIAHDFNNILFPIVGYTEMTIEDVPEKSTVRKNLNEVLKSALRARDLVKQILTFSRQQNQELKPLRIQAIVKEALKLIRSTLPTTIEIRQDIDKDCGPVVADPTQTHQIVMNLCTNAYHAMEETGGALEVNLSEIELTMDDIAGLDMEPGPYLCLKVGDTGHGMDRAVADRVFDPYFTTKETGKGTGLGLSVVHGIVKSYGGDIRVYSEPGKGTVFHVYLPRIKEISVSSESVSDEVLQTGHEHILLVDDEEVVVSLEKRMLERLDYKVTARTSSVEALEAFREQPGRYDLVITDMTMPNMTGDRLAAALKEIRSDIPIIICTGFSEKISKERADSLGIKGFLMKPIVMKDLSKTIRKVLDNKESPGQG
jgi:PAS domain S-box-containing protein